MKKTKVNAVYIILLPLLLFHTSCTLPQRKASEPTSFTMDGKSVENGQVSQAELQDDILRFESQFNARIQSANQALENSETPNIRYRATLNRLIYSSNSLNIALGPSPESNLLDMVTFIELSRDALKKHWIPRVFGTAGQPLDEAFADSREQIWAIAEKVLNPKQGNQLQKVISKWRSKHPDQINVETVRLSAFSSETGAKAAGLDENVGGLFASVQQSTRAVDSARLFAERALYYAERAPFLFRLHARLGAHEIIDDSGLTLVQQESMITGLMNELQQTLLISKATLGDANLTVKSVSTLLGELSDNPQAAQSATAAITELTALLKEWNQLLSSESYQKGISQTVTLANQINRESNQLLRKLALLGVGLISFFWIMYILSKLAYRYFLLRLPGSAAAERRDEHKDKAA